LKGRSPLFAAPEGLDLELVVVETTDKPLVAKHPEIPEGLALQGFDGVRAYSSDPDRSRDLLEQTLAFEPQARLCYKAGGERRTSWFCYEEGPGEPGCGCSVTGQHVAWGWLPHIKQGRH